MLPPSTLVLLLALVGAAPYKACTLWEPLPVKLFNHAAVENGPLRLAKGEAAWLLKSVCVVVDWVPCAVVSVSHPEPCAAPSRAIELHILPSPLTDGFTETAMGFAFLSRGNAAVFLSRVRQLEASNLGIIDLSGLLGHVMAQEIGHLMLNSSVHSSEGLMRADFRRVDLKKAAQRQLLFTAGQATAIRRNAEIGRKALGRSEINK